MNVSILWSFLLLSIFNSSQALAGGWHCSKATRKCEVYDRNLVVKDEVGFFTTRDELIAIGIVESMREERRMVKLIKFFGPISEADYTSRLLKGSSGVKIYQGRSRNAGGVDFRIGNFGIGGHLVTQHLGINYDRRFHRNGSWGVRAEYLTGSGEIVSQDYYDENGGRQLHLKGLSILPGIIVDSEELAALSLRAEANAGITYISRTIGDLSEEAVSFYGYKPQVDDGIGFSTSATASVQYSVAKHFKARFSFQYGLMHRAEFTSLGLGIQTDL